MKIPPLSREGREESSVIFIEREGRIKKEGGEE